MAVNSGKPRRWKDDIARSVDLYNDWFVNFAPKAYRETRQTTTVQVASALRDTKDLLDISPSALRAHPKVLPMLRMATAPPLARDRLIGLAKVSRNLVASMEEEGRIPPQMPEERVTQELATIGGVIRRLADPDIFTWLEAGTPPSVHEQYRAATIVADRLCGSIANPIIRNAQERRQLATIKQWLEARGYAHTAPSQVDALRALAPGTFTFRLNVPVTLADGGRVNVPIDTVVMPQKRKRGRLPLLLEAKSAGDLTNVNKRRKEEAVKVTQLRATYGQGVQYILFLCGYFDSGYLGYEASEGIDWVWEHRLDDLEKLGL